MKNKWSWVILAVLLYMANDVSMRVLANDTNFTSGCIMQALPLILLSGIMLLKEKNIQQYRKSIKIFLLILAYGAIQVLAGNLLYFMAMRYSGISVASPTVQSQAIWAVLLGAFVLKEKISNQAKVGIVIFAIGISMLAYFKSYGAKIHTGLFIGAIFGILAGLSWATGSLIQKVLFAQGINQNTIFFMGTIFGIFSLSILGLVTQQRSFVQSFLQLNTLKMLIPGVFSSVATWCFAKALKQTPLSVIIPIISVNIILNTISGAILFGEYVNLGTIMGLIMAFIGIILSQNIKRRRL